MNFSRFPEKQEQKVKNSTLDHVSISDLPVIVQNQKEKELCDLFNQVIDFLEAKPRKNYFFYEEMCEYKKDNEPHTVQEALSCLKEEWDEFYESAWAFAGNEDCLHVGLRKFDCYRSLEKLEEEDMSNPGMAYAVVFDNVKIKMKDMLKGKEFTSKIAWQRYFAQYRIWRAERLVYISLPFAENDIERARKDLREAIKFFSLLY